MRTWLSYICAALLASFGADPASANSSLLDGKWTGSYKCGSRIADFVLATKDGRGIVQFDYQEGPSGSFAVDVQFKSADNQIDLVAQRWIERPKRFVLANFKGQLSASRTMISGTMSGSCQEFYLKKADGKPVKLEASPAKPIVPQTPSSPIAQSSKPLPTPSAPTSIATAPQSAPPQKPFYEPLLGGWDGAGYFNGYKHSWNGRTDYTEAAPISVFIRANGNNEKDIEAYIFEKGRMQNYKFRNLILNGKTPIGLQFEPYIKLSSTSQSAFRILISESPEGERWSRTGSFDNRTLVMRRRELSPDKTLVDLCKEHIQPLLRASAAGRSAADELKIAFAPHLSMLDSSKAGIAHAMLLHGLSTKLSSKQLTDVMLDCAVTNSLGDNEIASFDDYRDFFSVDALKAALAVISKQTSESIKRVPHPSSIVDAGAIFLSASQAREKLAEIKIDYDAIKSEEDIRSVLNENLAPILNASAVDALSALAPLRQHLKQIKDSQDRIALEARRRVAEARMKGIPEPFGRVSHPMLRAITSGDNYVLTNEDTIYLAAMIGKTSACQPLRPEVRTLLMGVVARGHYNMAFNINWLDSPGGILQSGLGNTQTFAAGTQLVAAAGCDHPYFAAFYELLAMSLGGTGSLLGGNTTISGPSTFNKSCSLQRTKHQCDCIEGVVTGALGNAASNDNYSDGLVNQAMRVNPFKGAALSMCGL